MNDTSAADPGRKPASLAEIALLFLKLGTTAFGGPAAHIAMMEDEFVRRRKWLSRQEFLDRLGASNLIPGPSSTELAIHIGYSQRGWPGLVIAGCCFIVPAAIMVSLIAAAYVRYGSLPRVEHILYAIKPVVIAVVAQAFWTLGRTAVKNAWLGAIGAICLVAYLLHARELPLLAAAGIAAALPVLARTRSKVALLLAPLGVAASNPHAVPFSVLRLFLTFLKIGSVLFGSGYVLLAFLRSDFVDRLRWLTEKQVIDAVAVGQVTPGPVFTTATFIGYLVGGARGAAVATAAVFLPAFILVAASGPLIPRIRRSAIAGAFLDGVIVGSLALIGGVGWQLGRAAIVDVTTLAIAVISAVLLFRFRVNSAWLVLGAALVGWVL
jgi:chromate transporter